MKRCVIIICCCLMMACAADVYAQTAVTADDEYEDMTTLRKKLVRMKQEMDAFMKDIVSTYSDDTTSPFAGMAREIKVDVAENDREFIVKADMPGMSKDKIEVTLENERLLRISGTRESLIKEDAPGMVRQERSFGNVERALQLPGEGMARGIRASYKDGVLEVIIPKKEKSAKEAMVKVAVR